MSRLAILSSSPEETETVGCRLGAFLVPGTFVALHGELGSGKTCFTRGIVAGAAPASSHLVASPTYAIMNEYPGAMPVYHFDFYRLSSSREIAELGFEEYFLGDGVCIVEWSERLDDLLPSDHLSILLEHAGADRRTLIFEAAGSKTESILNRFAKSVGSENFL